jgi:hypothetical protein
LPAFNSLVLYLDQNGTTPASHGPSRCTPPGSPHSKKLRPVPRAPVQLSACLQILGTVSGPKRHPTRTPPRFGKPTAESRELAANCWQFGPRAKCGKTVNPYERNLACNPCPCHANCNNYPIFFGRFTPPIWYSELRWKKGKQPANRQAFLRRNEVLSLAHL